jgi:hypothetical protein
MGAPGLQFGGGALYLQVQCLRGGIVGTRGGGGSRFYPFNSSEHRAGIPRWESCWLAGEPEFLGRVDGVIPVSRMV